MSLPIDFSTLAGVAAVNVFVTEAIVKGCKVTKEWTKQLISWVTPLLLSVVGLLCQLGLFADYGAITEWQAWIYTIVTGLGLGLVSNGLYDIPFIQKLLDWLRSIFKKKTDQTLILPESCVDNFNELTTEVQTTASTDKYNDDAVKVVIEKLNSDDTVKHPNTTKKEPAKKTLKRKKTQK